MRIAIDAHMVGTRETGNETYTLNLIKALQQLDDGNTYLLLTDDPHRLRSRIEETPWFQVRQVRPAQDYLRIPLGMPWLAWREHVDVLHVTYNAPPVCPCPIVVTVHDISFRLDPDQFSPRDRLILSTLVPLSMRRAARVITVSNAARADILRHYRVPPERVVATPEAADEAFRPITDRATVERVARGYGLEGPFMLAVGNLQPRKNLPRLVAAFAGVRGAGETTVKLAIVGKAQWQESEVYAAVRQHGLDNAVIFTGYVPDEDLVALYNAAAVFVYPSLYEGFGLPPLEAMACGTPVVASRADAIAEVCGDAALLVSPTDVAELTRGLLRVLRDPALAASLRERGFRRVRDFSWRKTAEQTLAIYEAAAKSSAKIS